MTSFKASYPPSRLLICGDLDAPVADDCSIKPGLDDVIDRSVWNSMSGHRSGTIRTIYSISSSRINLRIFEMCGSSTQDCCRITNSSLHQSTSPHRPTSNPDFVSHHCSPHQPRTRIHSQIRSTLTEYVCDTQIDPYINGYHVFFMWY